MAAVEFITRTNINGTYDSNWYSYDCTSLLSGLSTITTASGVLLEYVWSEPTSADVIGFRRGDSTDIATWKTSAQLGVRQVAIGLDPVDNTFDYNAASGAGVPSIYVIGFFNADDVVFLQNRVSYTGGVGAYADVDISSQTGVDTATAGIFHFVSERTNSTDFGWRNNGTSETTIYGTFCNGSLEGDGLVICGVDGNEICETNMSSGFAGDKIHLVGYFKSGITWKDTATDISTATAGSYQSTSITPTGAYAAYVVSFHAADVEEGFGVRKDATGNDGYGEVAQVTTHLVEIDASDNIEQHIQTTSRDLYLRATIDSLPAGPAITPLAGRHLQNLMSN